MKITRETVESVVGEKKAEGMSNEEIEQEFKDALRMRAIDINIFYMAMDVIYEEG